MGNKRCCGCTTQKGVLGKMQKQTDPAGMIFCSVLPLLKGVHEYLEPIANTGSERKGNKTGLQKIVMLALT